MGRRGGRTARDAAAEVLLVPDAVVETGADGGGLARGEGEDGGDQGEGEEERGPVTGRLRNLQNKNIKITPVDRGFWGA